jgi:20S proteasome alpha/beta subunit
METFGSGIRDKHPGHATLLQIYRTHQGQCRFTSFCLQIVEIDSHIACAFSGLTADSKTLIDRARVECQNHWFTYDEKMQVGYFIGNF